MKRLLRPLEKETSALLFPAGVPELSFKQRLVIYLLVNATLLSSAVLLADFASSATSLRIALNGDWLFRSELLFLGMSSLVLYRAHRSWKAEDYHAYRDRTLLAVLSTAAMLFIHLYGLSVWLDVHHFAGNPVFVLLQSIMALYAAITLCFLTISLTDYWRNTSYIDGFILSLRPWARFRVQMAGLTWVLMTSIWAYIHLFV